MGNKQSGDEETSYNNSTSGRGGEGDDFHYSNVTKVVHNATHQHHDGLSEEQKRLTTNKTNIEDRISLRWLSKQPPNIILENFKVLSIGTRLRLLHQQNYNYLNDMARDKNRETGNNNHLSLEAQKVDKKDQLHIYSRLLRTHVFSSFDQEELQNLSSSFEKIQYC